MIRKDWEHHNAVNDFLAARFEGKQSLYVGIDLRHARIVDGQYVYMDRDVAGSVARRFRNKINQKYYGNAAKRYGKGLTMTFSFHTETHYHLHCVIEIPSNGSLLKFRSEIEFYCLNDPWINSMPNISKTVSEKAVQRYNNRQGFDALILF